MVQPPAGQPQGRISVAGLLKAPILEERNAEDEEAGRTSFSGGDSEVD